MNVLSLFDGMSCGQIALAQCGYTVDNYYAAEIDKYAIQVTQANYPNTIQLGDVTKVKGADLPKIDLLIGGSPCQGFSFAGKQLNFEDPRSALFFEFVRLLDETKPKYFFLENVRMKKEYQDVISKYLGVEPVALNSNVVSAQNRYRLYWTNIPGYTAPEDKGILLKDIVHEYALVDRDKSHCLDANYAKGTNLEQYLKKCRRQIVFNVNPSGKGMNGVVQSIDKDKCNTLTTNKGEGQKIVFERKVYQINPSLESNGRQPFQHNRVYDTRGLSPCLNTDARSPGVLIEGYIRKLSPVECERLQTVPDNYTAHVSNSQRYKMLGNGWTVDAVCEFFKHIEQDI